MNQAKTQPSLLLSAFPSELAGLDQDPPPGWQVACTGVGAVTAAAATALLLGTLKPARVLFVGTCGAFDERLAVGDLIEATEALSISLDELEGRGYRPDIERVRWPATLALPKALGLPAHTVAVPLVVTQTVDGAKRLAMHAAVEHLELIGVFAACHAAGVPCGAVLAVSNRVGPNAHREWQANHARVSQGLIDSLVSKNVFSLP